MRRLARSEAHPLPLPARGKGEDNFWGMLPRATAASRPCPGLLSVAPIGAFQGPRFARDLTYAKTLRDTRLFANRWNQRVREAVVDPVERVEKTE